MNLRAAAVAGRVGAGRRTWPVAVLCCALCGSACRSGSGASDDPDSGIIGGSTIMDLQGESMPIGASIDLEGVVVVAIDTFGGRVGGLYVMEPEGGPFSGVFVFLTGTEAGTLQPGNLVDVTGGVKDEFALAEDTSGRTLTELSAPEGGRLTVTKVGEGVVPEPALVDPVALAGDDAEAEKWEGVLVRMDNVAVTSAPRNVSSTDETLKEMTVTGPFRVSSSLAELPDSIARDDCYQSIVGIGDYFFEYKILPRSAADLVAGGSACPPQEADAAQCADGLDNDHDGFVDCQDFSCRDSFEGCFVESTVVAVQDGTIAEGSPVVLPSVVVTAIDRDRTQLWVQDEGITAQHNGVYVFRGESAAALPAAIQIGSRVRVEGIVKLFFGATEVSATEVVWIDDGAEVVVIGELAASTIPPLTTGAPYEGGLVTVSDVKVLETGLMFGRFSVGATASPLIIDGIAYAYDAQVGSCLASITGVVQLNTFDQYYMLLPRQASDVVTGGSCP